ncbi:MAG: TagA domain-containing protein, partial [Myxococcota bacterium]|nr:TagA domain-containing protein [Myxococcota bacterium]
TLLHFTSGTADSWGIGDEYPSDGQNMSSHPWGYDTTRRQFRTWYQVDGNGPVEGDDAGLNGKYDPMNGGESANSLTCFPQYTGYHAAQVQDWSESSPTLAELDGVAGAWLWNPETHAHESYTVDSEYQEPELVDVPVVTLIGTLGGLEEQTRQTYPPIYSISGNVFTMPDPEDPDLDSGYEDARWFLQVHYGDGSSERALIDVGEVGTTELYVYALNLSAELDPVRAELYHSDTAWPSIDVDGATLVHSRDIEVPEDSTLPPVVTAGHGAIANGSLNLTDWCTPDLDCESRDAQSSWRIASGALTFRDPDGQIEDPESCLEPDDYSILTVPVVNTDGDTSQVIVHGQRLVEAGGTTISVPLNDRTPWIDAADLTQS